MNKEKEEPKEPTKQEIVGLVGPYTREDMGGGVTVFTTKIGQITIENGQPVPGPDGKY